VRQAILESAQLAVQRGLLQAADEVWFLKLGELAQLLEGTANASLTRERIAQRQEAHARFARLTPPRLMTSDGESLKAASAFVLPPNTLAGIAASSGVVEGFARVILDPARDRLAPGEILVAPFTDPGWTPLFVHARALVMEVGGMMTHGSVIAREYGLPAVVGVEGATHTIQTGQRLRVDGDHGLVILLDKEQPA
jgi:pyruvate,water dikinase